MKNEALAYLTQNGGKPEDLTWNQLAEKFQLTGKNAGDKLRKVWSRHNKRKERYEHLITRRVWQQRTKNGEIVELRSFNNVPSLEEFDAFRKEFIEDVKEYSSSPIEPLKITPTKDSYLCEISLADFHLGRVNLDQAEALHQKALEELVSKASRAYTIDQFVFVVGNDLFNSDNDKYATTKGTPQFDKDPWHVMFRAGWQMMVKSIDALKQIAPVHVVCVMGNHDRTRVLYMSDVLQAYFKNDPLVTVNNEFEEFKFVQYGNSLIMYEHGELKPQDYPLIMATEEPIKWSKSKYREVHTGHFHKERLFEERGVKVRYMPSLALESEWERTRGYSHLRQGQAMVWSKTQGLEAIFHFNYDNE